MIVVQVEVVDVVVAVFVLMVGWLVGCCGCGTDYCYGGWLL